MKKTFLIACFCLILVGAGLALNSNYDRRLNISGTAITTVDVTSIGLTQSIWVTNDSSSLEVYINWDGRATREVDITLEGYSMLIGTKEAQSRIIQSRGGPKLLCSTATSETAPIRIGIIIQ